MLLYADLRVFQAEFRAEFWGQKKKKNLGRPKSEVGKAMMEAALG